MNGAAAGASVRALVRMQINEGLGTYIAACYRGAHTYLVEDEAAYSLIRSQLLLQHSR